MSALSPLAAALQWKRHQNAIECGKDGRLGHVTRPLNTADEAIVTQPWPTNQPPSTVWYSTLVCMLDNFWNQTHLFSRLEILLCIEGSENGCWIRLPWSLLSDGWKVSWLASFETRTTHNFMVGNCSSGKMLQSAPELDNERSTECPTYNSPLNILF